MLKIVTGEIDMKSNLLNKKIEYWENQLLDLGKRNKMINYRETKRSTLKLIEPSFSELFNSIAIDEKTLTFQRAVDRETDIRVFSILSLLENLSNPLPVTIGDIKAEGSILERQRTLKSMRSKSRLAFEEQGINILYLSFGFIEWKDGKGASAKWIKSPLILVPAVLTLDSLNSPYTLSKHEDDIVVNPTLEYYLKAEYGIELPHFDVDKETIDDYLKNLEEIADRRGWRIIKEVSLGLLSFLKITMYNDLRSNEKRIKNNPVIRAMAGNTEQANDIPEELSTFDLDSIKTQDCYQVMSADSSQQDAILYSKNNISFVMQGPPGTGKSQTITNIIAEALADGKKVLFVSEKMAALQVVYRRLQEAHLADFCLPLHSYKANKREILEQIGNNLKLKQTRVKDTAITSLEELLAIRQELNSYASELHELIPELNISCYEVYSKLEEVNDAPTVVFVFDDPLNTSQANLQACLNALNEYSLSLRRLNYFIKNNPWDGLSARVSGYEYSQKMHTELDLFNKNLELLLKEIQIIFKNPESISDIGYNNIPFLFDLLQKIAAIPIVPDKWIETDYDIAKAIAVANEAKNQYNEILKLEETIGNIFHQEIYGYDYNIWKSKLFEFANGFLGMPFIVEEQSDFYIKNATLLLDCFSLMKEKLTIANKAFAEINNLLGTKFISNTHSQQAITELLAIIRTNTILKKNWFSIDIDKARKLINEAKTMSIDLKTCKEKVLEEWEPEVLSLDYSPILLRYKTDYTSVFKVFNSQYKKDKKQIQALSKTVIKKLTDDIAINLLSSLKEINDKIAWFIDNNEELTEIFSTYYSGVDSDWDFLLSAMNIVENLVNSMPDGVPQEIIDLVAFERSTQIDLLESSLASMETSFSQAKDIAMAKNLLFDFDSVDFDSNNALEVVSSYISKLEELSSHKDLLKPYLINEEEPIDVVYETIQQLNLHNKAKNDITSKMDEYNCCFGFLYSDYSTNWDSTVDLLEQLAEIKQSSLYGQVSFLMNSDENIKQKLKIHSAQIMNIYTASKNSYEWIGNQFSSEIELGRLDVENLLVKLKDCFDNINILESWIDYQEAKDSCSKNGLCNFINKIEEDELFVDIDKVFLKGFYHMWLGAVCDKADSLRRFRRNVHDERIKKFIELDDLQLRIAQMRIREKLIENLPTSNRLLKATDEVSILNKELGKKRNIMPLRKLFKQIPNLLMKLKPCLMMSPLSVSYFLETEAYHFDLVIFDEASQIFPEDAIGAIFRGSQVIIAGDSKQMPPTNFFSTTTTGFGGDYDVDDEQDFDEIISDSILEESAAVLPNRTLLWHYRSKNENLIAFSNREIYKNNLITFPNSVNNAPDMGVQYVYVSNGYYEGNGKNCNIREAQKCVMLVLDHIQKHPERSLGIIAFSEKQQTAIENAIIDFRERMPQYEWFFDESKDEPFFVKNLENVQGDERDTIIFSICYAKDKNGKMYMRFGPLGHEGGERRLNVAITRAKCNVKLVGSILPSDIDLSRTNSEGVRMLRSYIEFAMKGAGVLKPVEREEDFETTDEFCSIVAAFLESKGYKVQRKVGCSDYKIDIAVENPNAEGEFIAGIECDGLSYVHAKTARDRDHLRKTVLENMGWNLYRIWSTEWIRSPEIEKKALIDFLQSVFDKNGNVIHSVKQSNEDENCVDADEIASESAKTIEKVSSVNPYKFEYYKQANWRNTKHSGSYDNLVRISENVLHVVSVEEPIHMEMLYRRLGPSFTTGKATESVRTTIDDAIKKKLKGKVKIDKDNFIRLVPLNQITVRIPKDGDTPRAMEFIHTEEVALAMIQIIKNSFGITQEDLATECARAFGFERKGPKIKAKTDAAIKWLIDKKRISFIDGKAQLIGEYL